MLIGALRSSRPALHQLQQRERGHGLADAADLEGGVGEHRAPRRQIGVADTGGEEGMPAVGERDGHPRRPARQRASAAGIRSGARSFVMCSD